MTVNNRHFRRLYGKIFCLILVYRLPLTIDNLSSYSGGSRSMSDPNAEQEPSMEEILASIRRIIPEDGEEDTAEEPPEPKPDRQRATKTECWSSRTRFRMTEPWWI